VKFTYPDRKTDELNGKAGQAQGGQRWKHLPENVGPKKLELILVETKTK